MLPHALNGPAGYSETLPPDPPHRPRLSWLLCDKRKRVPQAVGTKLLTPSASTTTSKRFQDPHLLSPRDYATPHS